MTNWCYIDGRSTEKLYKIYSSIRNRTSNVKNAQYNLYGGRGIKMCDEWINDYPAFKKWAYENGYNENAPKGQCSIDRIDNNKGYSPSNCRWVDANTQARNKRTTRIIEYNGKKQCAKDWAKELNVNYLTFLTKLDKGYTVEQIIDWKKSRERL